MVQKIIDNTHPDDFLNYARDMAPVSYTHLDVYKRQVTIPYNIFEKMMNKELAVSAIETFNRHGAVSYTHLDVYKRQLLRVSCLL